LRLIILCTLFVLSISVSAAETELPWSPGAPVHGSELTSDWVQLEHGEWLVGEFLSLRDEELMFDSEEFDDLSLEWDKIRSLYLTGDVITVLLDGRVVRGPISVSSEGVLLHKENESVNRGTVISIVPAVSQWWELWNGRISSGLTLRSGNTTQVDLQIKATAVLRTAFNRLNFSYIGSFSRVEGVSIASNNNAGFSWNYYVSYRAYIIPAAYDFVSDPFRNIRQQHTPSVGFGYDLINKSKIDWALLGGAGYQYLEYSSVESGQSTSFQSVVLQAQTKLRADITGSSDLDFNYTIDFDMMNLKNIVQNLSAQLNVDITHNLELDVMFSWNRVGDPEKREDGSVPKKDDLSLTAGISFEY